MWEGRYPEWDDTVVPRFGVEYEVVKDLFLRTGYYYEGSPVPDQRTTRSNYLDFDKHAISAGAGIEFTKLPVLGEIPLNYPVSIDAFLQYQWMEDRTQNRPLENKSWRIEGYQLALGVGLSTGF
jgi:hypothetical protein